MARHYTWSDMLYAESIESNIIASTGASGLVELKRASKKLLVRNDGPNDVFLAFDEDTAETTDFKITNGDGLVELPVQCEKVAVICATGETASVRIGSCY